jgi:2,3-dihydroxyphenylpropionate 1,2-dioxygenase
MNTHGAQPAHEDRAERFRAAIDKAARMVSADRTDLVVVVGPNHFRGLWLDLMPAFTIGVGAVEGSGESGTLLGPLRTDPDAARAICEHLVGAGFDMAFSNRLQVDHGITQAVQLLLGDAHVAVVPLLVNAFAPPLPTLGRCLELGSALGDAVAALPGDRRVTVIASGGLSHQLPWPDWRHPASEDERFMVEAWSAGREHWTEFEARRRQLVLGAAPHIDTEHDNELLELLATGRLGELRGRDEELARRAGNGGSEIRAWLVMAAATGHRAARRLAYEPMPEWLTGMAVAITDDESTERG